MAHSVTLAVYRATSGLPATERFGLVQQARRAAVSIASDIAEGRGRASDADFARFLDMAMGSANELEYLLLVARDLAYLDRDTHRAVLDSLLRTKRMLAQLIRRLRPREPKA